MPIVSISKIQHRYGLGENLPQLAAAEFGWAIDQRRLYIGNGPTSEGSPAIGNTEILTQYSNLLEVAENSYTYKDTAVGFDAITGESSSSPITRSLQEKLDDFANVRDYGAKGNNIDDDTDAINRALKDLFTRDTRASVRRILYFPAGIYKVSDVIKIPPYATIQGEGKNCTIILATDSSAAGVAQIADSKLQAGASTGANGAILPAYISINDITFNANSLNLDVMTMQSAKYISFNNVGFDGGLAAGPSTGVNLLVGVAVLSTPINHSQNIVFNKCEFSGTEYGCILDDDMENIIFDQCTFQKLYIGAKIGEDILGSGASVVGPLGARIINSLFDKIYNSGLVVYKTAKVTSAFNTYFDVGNQLISTPFYPAILFNDLGAASICDSFARNNVDNLIVPRISYGSTASIFIEPNLGLFVGKRELEAGSVITLFDATSSATNTGISFDVSQKSQKINYIATRGTIVRNGTLEVTATAAGITVSDTFTENGTDIGLTMSCIVSGSNALIQYITTTTGTNITFSYSVDRNLV